MNSLGFVLLLLGAAGFLFAYLGYPLLIWLQNPRKRVTAPQKKELPGLRLIIPVHNEERIIVGKIRNVLEQDYPEGRLEIVVVDDGSTDRTRERIREEFGDRVRVLTLHQNGGKNAALNSAMELLRPHPPLVGTTDADALLAPGALRNLAVALEDESVGLAAARVVYTDSSGQFREQQYFSYESFVRELESRDACCVAIAGQLEVHRSELWQDLPKNVSTDMGTALAVLSQGAGVVVVPEAVAYTSTTVRALDELGRKARTVKRGLRASAWKWRDLGSRAAARVLGHKVLRFMTAGFQSLIFAGSALLAARAEMLGLLLFPAQVAFYGAVGIGWFCARRDIRWRPARLLTNLFYFQAVFLVAFVELLRWLAGDESVPAWSRARLDEEASSALTPER